jgi:hypothetical protein
MGCEQDAQEKCVFVFSMNVFDLIPRLILIYANMVEVRSMLASVCCLCNRDHLDRSPPTQNSIECMTRTKGQEL